jgi:Ca-activated chloride channel family protein
LILSTASPLFSQYYLRGEVRNEQNEPVQGAKILLFSKANFPFYSGSTGAFGIPTSLKTDTITFMAEGYEVSKLAVETSKYQVFTLKSSTTKVTSTPLRLSSFTKDLLSDKPHYPSVLGESYSSTVENEFVEAKQFPRTGYAINVDRACYSNIRRFLNIRAKPPVDAVRLEEMLNYFNFSTKPDGLLQETFSINSSLTSCPWNIENQLLFISLQAKKINLDKTPPTNLVFLVDVSGSMDMPNRLPLLQSAFKLLVENLRSKDTVSIVTYGGSVTIVLQPTGGANKQKIIEGIESLKPSGATPGEAAIRVAYKLAKTAFIRGGNNRVILATDGDFNIGQTSEKELEDLISQQRKTGIFLTCLGVGMGNYKDSKLEALAKKGNGNFAYIDNEMEAQKVLVEEFAQTVYTVASDVYLTVDFNPDLVKDYRLIGFDNRQSAMEDSSSELEGGEVGSGHRLLSIFEISPTELNKQICNKLAEPKNITQLSLSYKLPQRSEVLHQQFGAPHNYKALAEADSCLRFASSVIMFGSMIKQSKYSKDISWDDIHNLALSATQPHNVLQAEFLELVQKAKKIYGNKKKKW